MGAVLRFGAALHAAVTRPFRRPPIDYDERGQQERRRARLVERLERLRALQAEADAHTRGAGRRS